MAKPKTKKKSAAQLEREVATTIAGKFLPKDWPADARSAVLTEARRYHQQIREPYAVPEVAMEQAIDEVNYELVRLDAKGTFRDAPRWHRRFEEGKLDDEIKRAITAWSRTVANAEPRM